MPARTFAQPTPGHRDARAQIDRAVAEVRAADDTLADLQDSMLPVEVGDAELRAAVADVREHLGGARARRTTLRAVLVAARAPRGWSPASGS